ncbi:hypothetical protein [Lentzea sp. CA-135723]|uniref:hypothetical protein n=1 Tax=Lentzea sp. CA-135723 TaxID=3239950 RepID=UPI003D8C9C70
MHTLVLKAVLTPLLIGAASAAGRRWGHQIGGWLVALPLTSGPVAYFLATDYGTDFAAQASTGMLAATASQVLLALAYRSTATRGALTAFIAGTAVFAAATLALTYLQWPALPTFLLVLGTIGVAVALTRRTRAQHDRQPSVAKPPWWDMPARMVVATGVVLTITTLAPIIGPQLAGLLSPFPVFGVILALFTHLTHDHHAASAVLDGLVLGLAAPAVFFLVLSQGLAALGLSAFVLATLGALLTQLVTMIAMERAAPRQLAT